MFEFDKNKSIANKNKHNIDFNEAQQLWKDEDRVIIPAKTVDEPRYLLIAKLYEKYWDTFEERYLSWNLQDEIDKINSDLCL